MRSARLLIATTLAVSLASSAASAQSSSDAYESDKPDFTDLFAHALTKYRLNEYLRLGATASLCDLTTIDASMHKYATNAINAATKTHPLPWSIDDPRSQAVLDRVHAAKAGYVAGYMDALMGEIRTADDSDAMRASICNSAKTKAIELLSEGVSYDPD